MRSVVTVTGLLACLLTVGPLRAQAPATSSSGQPPPVATPAPAAAPAPTAAPATPPTTPTTPVPTAAAATDAGPAAPDNGAEGLGVTIPRPPDVADGDRYPVEDEAGAMRWMDKRFLTGDYVDLYRGTKPHMEKETRPELMWRYSRILINYYEGFRDLPEAEKMKAYSLSEKLMRTCVTKYPETQPHCYLQLGISIGRVATLRGVLRSLRSASTVESLWLKGLKLCQGKPYKMDADPLESHFYYVLGIFYRLVPDWWIVKVMAGTRGDKQKSIDFHRKSVEQRPDPSTWLELGVALVCRGSKEDDDKQFKEGLQWIRKVSEITPKHDLDRVDKRNALMVLAKNNLACGYSRDKFQDVDDQSKVK